MHPRFISLLANVDVDKTLLSLLVEEVCFHFGTTQSYWCKLDVLLLDVRLIFTSIAAEIWYDSYNFIQAICVRVTDWSLQLDKKSLS